MNKPDNKRLLLIIIALLFLGIASGCATTKDLNPTDERDQFETANRAAFELNETLDQHLLKPIVEPYVKYTPVAIRTGVTNFFANITYLNVVLNSFLQGKFEQGLSDSTRFVFNSTIGLAGLMDVATPMGLEKHNEDLGQTFAIWGFEQGSYLYVPLLGPDTVRKSPDIITRTLVNPLTYISGPVLIPFTVLNVINTRANLLEFTNLRDEIAIEPYSFTREAYLQQRENLIYDGNPPVEDFDDVFDDFEEESSDGGTLIIK